MPDLHQLQREIAAFMAKHKMAETKFGRLAVNDPRFVRDIRVMGRSPHVRTIQRVMTFMASYGQAKAA